MPKLPLSFYTRPDVVTISKELLGKCLITRVDGKISGGIIVETEAYSGQNDKACHANNGRRTARTEIMYARGGMAYVYLCYGIHHLFNIVTNVKDTADAVLIRAIEPLEGMDEMLRRRGMQQSNIRLTNGPGSLTKALGIDIRHYGQSLLNDEVWVEDRGLAIPSNQINSGTRVGVSYAEEDALKPWRFSIKGNPWVSPAK